MWNEKKTAKVKEWEASKQTPTGMSLVAMHWLGSDVSWDATQPKLLRVSAEYLGPTPNSTWYISNSCSVGLFDRGIFAIIR